MKRLAENRTTSAVRIPPAVALSHPSYQSPAVQAAAALRILAAQFTLKKIRGPKTTGHA